MERHYLYIYLEEATVEELSAAWHGILEQIIKYRGDLETADTSDGVIKVCFSLPNRYAEHTDTVLVYADHFSCVRVFK